MYTDALTYLRPKGSGVLKWFLMGMRYMKKTWKEKVTGKLKRKIYKYKYFKLPWIIALVFVTVIGSFSEYMVHNSKRFASIAAVFLFFIISSSFAFPYMQEDELLTEDQVRIQEIESNYEYVPTVLDISSNEVIETEADTQDEYSYNHEGLDAQEDVDQFSLDDILEANEVSTATADDSEALAESAELTADDWRLLLVNKQHPVPDDYTFTAGRITGNMKCDARIIDDLLAMMEAAKADGINLMVCSPYRDYDRQTMLFNRKIDYYMEKGYSYLEAYKTAAVTVNVPGASEHQIGLALDIVSDTYPYLEIEFGDTPAGKWLNEHSCEYGFILRYPLGKEYVTGIQYEPWHFRYVGKEAATIIMSQGITLEEFLEDL